MKTILLYRALSSLLQHNVFAQTMFMVCGVIRILLIFLVVHIQLLSGNDLRHAATRVLEYRRLTGVFQEQQSLQD